MNTLNELKKNRFKIKKQGYFARLIFLLIPAAAFVLSSGYPELFPAFLAPGLFIASIILVFTLLASAFIVVYNDAVGWFFYIISIAMLIATIVAAYCYDGNSNRPNTKECKKSSIVVALVTTEIYSPKNGQPGYSGKIINLGINRDFVFYAKYDKGSDNKEVIKPCSIENYTYKYPKCRVGQSERKRDVFWQKVPNANVNTNHVNGDMKHYNTGFAQQFTCYIQERFHNRKVLVPVNMA